MVASCWVPTIPRAAGGSTLLRSPWVRGDPYTSTHKALPGTVIQRIRAARRYITGSNSTRATATQQQAPQIPSPSVTPVCQPGPKHYACHHNAAAGASANPSPSVTTQSANPPVSIATPCFGPPNKSTVYPLRTVAATFSCSHRGSWGGQGERRGKRASALLGGVRPQYGHERPTATNDGPNRLMKL